MFFFVSLNWSSITKRMSASKVLLVAMMASVLVLNAAASQEQPRELAPRSFGHHFFKRISFAIIPGAFVIGAVTTLLAALTIVSMNGLGVGVSSSSFH